jgi:hypothetical protein
MVDNTDRNNRYSRQQNEGAEKPIKERKMEGFVHHPTRKNISPF